MARDKTEAKAENAEVSEERPETGYRDVSKEAEQAAEDAKKGVELDDEGNVKSSTSEAAGVLADEQAYRASAQANGGGPWPPELLRERFVNPTPLKARIPEYTSHEESDES